MIPFLRLVQLILGSSGDHFLLMLQIVQKHVQKIHDLGLLTDEGQHIHPEGILQLGVLIELVQYHVGVGVLAQLDHHPHALSVGLIPYVRDPVHLFQLHQLRDLYDQIRLVHHIGKFCGYDLAFSVGQGLYIRYGPDNDLSPARPIGLLTASCT